MAQTPLSPAPHGRERGSKVTTYQRRRAPGTWRVPRGTTCLRVTCSPDGRRWRGGCGVSRRRPPAHGLRSTDGVVSGSLGRPRLMTGRAWVTSGPPQEDAARSVSTGQQGGSCRPAHGPAPWSWASGPHVRERWTLVAREKGSLCCPAFPYGRPQGQGTRLSPPPAQTPSPNFGGPFSRGPLLQGPPVPGHTTGRTGAPSVVSGSPERCRRAQGPPSEGRALRWVPGRPLSSCGDSRLSRRRLPDAVRVGGRAQPGRSPSVRGQP